MRRVTLQLNEKNAQHKKIIDWLDSIGSDNGVYTDRMVNITIINLLYKKAISKKIKVAQVETDSMTSTKKTIKQKSEIKQTKISQEKIEETDYLNNEFFLTMCEEDF